MNKILLFILSFILTGITITSTVSAASDSILENIPTGILVDLAGCPEPGSLLYASATINRKCSCSPSLEGSLAFTMSGEANAQNPACGQASNNRSVLSALALGMGTMIEETPASAEYYVADVLHNINPTFAQQTYAQGIGFGALSPVLGIWKMFRNVAYFLFVIVFIVIGFAIMFRAKLSAQTVVNIENALPQIIITLLLITFSYAIAGLMIDLMYLSIYLLIGLSETYIFIPGARAGLLGLAEIEPRKIALEGNIIANGLGFLFGAGGASTAANSVANIVSNFFTIPFPLLDIITGVISSVITSAIFYLIFVIAVIVQIFRTFFTMLGAYIQIVLAVIFAPIQLLMQAYPGSNAFSNWLRNLAANLAVFPVVIAMLFLALALMGIGTRPGIGYNQSTGGGFSPPQLGGLSETGSIQGLIAVGVLMMLPKTLELTRKAFQVQDSGLGEDVRAGLAPGMGVAMAPVNAGRWAANQGTGIVTGATVGMATSMLRGRVNRYGLREGLSPAGLRDDWNARTEAQKQRAEKDKTTKAARASQAVSDATRAVTTGNPNASRQQQEETD